jgi:hypothetical protein
VVDALGGDSSVVFGVNFQFIIKFPNLSAGDIPVVDENTIGAGFAFLPSRRGLKPPAANHPKPALRVSCH